jgi:CHAT domain-containing protein/Tfp pilus assembly protein PilF
MEALDYYQQALNVWQELKDQGGEAASLNNIGEVYVKMRRYSDALTTLEEALSIITQLDDYPSKWAVLGNIGSVHLEQGRYDQALDYFTQELKLLPEQDEPWHKAITLSNIGSVYDKQGKLREALEYYQQSLEIQESVRAVLQLEEFKTTFDARFAGKYERAVLLLARLGKPGEAFFMAERARARAFLDQLGNERPSLQAGSNTKLTEQEITLREEMASLEKHLQEEESAPLSQQNAAHIALLNDKIKEKRSEYEQLLVQLKLDNPEYASLVTVSPISITETQKLLDENTTLLSYFVAGDTTLAFIVKRDSLEVVELPVSEQEIIKANSDFRSRKDFEDPAASGLANLYTRLVAPLRSRLTTSLIGIIPHRELNYVPFAALYDGQHYLSDDYLLFSLPSASVLSYVKGRAKIETPKLLVLAYARPEGMPFLKKAEEEVQAIAALYGTQPVLGNEATEEMIDTRAGGYNLLHMAAHGQLDSANPLFSRIVLAPGGKQDGMLRVQEVYGLDLKAMDLVVLSACETQLGALSRGDDLIGLSRAFIYAGTSSVVASLWKVDDQATSVLMTTFYTHLKEGKGKAQALQAAQNEVRAQYPKPSHWAAFVLTGDPGLIAANIQHQIVQPQEPSNPGALLIITLIVVIALVALVVIWLIVSRRAKHANK